MCRAHSALLLVSQLSPPASHELTRQHLHPCEYVAAVEKFADNFEKAAQNVKVSFFQVFFHSGSEATLRRVPALA